MLSADEYVWNSGLSGDLGQTALDRTSIRHGVQLLNFDPDIHALQEVLGIRAESACGLAVHDEGDGVNLTLDCCLVSHLLLLSPIPFYKS